MPAKKPRNPYPSAKRALDAALRSRPLLPHEVGTVALAKRLAVELDQASDPEDVARMSRQLITALRSLGMTRDKMPAGAGGKVTDEPESRPAARPIDEYRDRRRRLRAAPPCDNTPS